MKRIEPTTLVFCNSYYSFCHAGFDYVLSKVEYVVSQMYETVIHIVYLKIYIFIIGK